MGVNGIYGLSGSGMDIESMVKVGMMSKQNEYDKMAQKFTKNEWLKADYLELSNKITTFNSSNLSQYKMSNNMNAKSAESSNSAVKVSATSGAALMNHKVEVESLSSNVYLLGVEGVTRKTSDSSKADSILLSDTIFGSMSKSGDTISVAYGTSGNFKSDFNSTDIAIRFMIDDGTEDSDDYKKMTDEEKASYKTAHTIEYTYGDIYGTDGTDGITYNQLVSKINSMDMNIKASYDSVNDRFSFYNTEGGSDNKITFKLDAITSTTTDVGHYSSYGNVDADKNVTDLSDAAKKDLATLNARDFLKGLHLMESRDGSLYSSRQSLSDWTYDTTTKTFTNADGTVTYNTADGKYYDADGNETTKPTGVGANPSAIELDVDTTEVSKKMSGTNGSMKIDGVSYTTTDNKVTANGITYTALNKTTEAATVSVSQDTDSIIDKVKSFITDYNKLLSDLYKKYDEKPNTDYKPLTQSQKDQMKDDQIEKWEEKAKTGLLYHDQTLGKIIMNMRNAVAESVDGVDGKYNSMFSLGVSTTGIKGQLTLDEDKLKAALAEDPDAVYNVFAKLDSEDLDNSAKSGVAQRLGDIFVDATKSIKDRAGSSADITEDSDLNNLLRNLQTKMSNFKKLMTSFENALYKKYDAMETTLAKLGTQLNYIMGSTGQ